MSIYLDIYNYLSNILIYWILIVFFIYKINIIINKRFQNFITIIYKSMLSHD